jgi:hypothetical protein
LDLIACAKKFVLKGHGFYSVVPRTQRNNVEAWLLKEFKPGECHASQLIRTITTIFTTKFS